ncbi:MAG: twin-arginine translocase subunit TatC [Desulfurococcaceae archaeon]
MAEESLLKYYERHIKELTKRLRRVFVTWFVSILLFISFPASVLNLETFLSGEYVPLAVFIVERVSNYVLQSSLLSNARVVFIAERLNVGFELWFLSAFVLSLLVAIPVLLFEIWRFIEPGLYEHEKKAFKKAFVPIVGSFMGGCLFGYFILVPIILRAFLAIMSWFNIQPMVSYMDFIAFILSTVVFSGIFMVTPFIIYVLISVGLIPVEPFIKYRAPIYVAIYVIAAIITPDGGSMGSAILAIPIIVLFEIVIQLAKRKASAKGKSCCRQ